jgi:hypothetical protein
MPSVQDFPSLQVKRVASQALTSKTELVVASTRSQLRSRGLHWTPRGELLADGLTAFSAGELALALSIEAGFISIDG